MFNLFGKKEETVAPETVSKVEHDRIVNEMQALIDSYADNAQVLRANNRALENAANHFKQQRDAARAEAEANKVDADKYRRSRANLKQFRKDKAA